MTTSDAAAVTAPPPEILRVSSRDGTPIAAYKSGSGPALVLVHGTTSNHSSWRLVLPLLEPHFTVYAMDRRGRGESGDNPAYSIAREYEDVAAVCAAIRGPVNLLGHSYGGLCALGAARHVRNLRRLVLYEPAAPTPSHPSSTAGTDAVDRLQAMIDAGDREGAVVTMLRDIALIAEEDIAVLRSLPTWKGRIAAAHTMPRELRADESWRFDERAFATFGAPTLLLLGSASPPEYRAGIDMLRVGLIDTKTRILPGQGHAAMATAPAMFADAVVEFLTGRSRAATPGGARMGDAVTEPMVASAGPGPITRRMGDVETEDNLASPFAAAAPPPRRMRDTETEDTLVLPNQAGGPTLKRLGEIETDDIPDTTSADTLPSLPRRKETLTDAIATQNATPSRADEEE